MQIVISVREERRGNDRDQCVGAERGRHHEDHRKGKKINKVSNRPALTNKNLRTHYCHIPGRGCVQRVPARPIQNAVPVLSHNVKHVVPAMRSRSRSRRRKHRNQPHILRNDSRKTRRTRTKVGSLPRSWITPICSLSKMRYRVSAVHRPRPDSAWPKIDETWEKSKPANKNSKHSSQNRIITSTCN